MSEVAPTYVVVSCVAPHITVEPLAKLDPVTVSVNGALPETAEAGVNSVIAGPLTVNVLAVDTPVAFRTVTLWAPAEASWVLVTDAVSEVALP